MRKLRYLTRGKGDYQCDIIGDPLNRSFRITGKHYLWGVFVWNASDWVLLKTFKSIKQCESYLFVYGQTKEA